MSRMWAMKFPEVNLIILPVIGLLPVAGSIFISLE
jgi:hypothetical protein